MYVKKIKEPEKLYLDVLGTFKSEIQEILQSKTSVNIAMAGGRSIGSFLSYLKDDAAAIDWSKINIFMLDERLVPIEHEESNFKKIHEELLTSLLSGSRISPDNIHPFIFTEGSECEGVKEYQAALDIKGGFFDIALISIGEDGHLASLFPKHPSIDDTSSGFILVDDSPKMPKRRMSCSKSLLLRTKVGIAFIQGEGKREAFVKLQDENTIVRDCPAVLIKDMEKSYIYTDI